MSGHSERQGMIGDAHIRFSSIVVHRNVLLVTGRAAAVAFTRNGDRTKSGRLVRSLRSHVRNPDARR
jgi:hypothetical protein